ncbi:unnamed protein product [Brassica oleracea var. botrytis]|uniref:(rape) hypothetical protein n=1 Tax=Brassica napus TaxID=3708 RepID=A0A816JI90_BRANA|nr:unnamed protein product [Brassica napus]
MKQNTLVHRSLCIFVTLFMAFPHPLPPFSVYVSKQCSGSAMICYGF